jgi:hypothetical protein
MTGFDIGAYLQADRAAMGGSSSGDDGDYSSLSGFGFLASLTGALLGAVGSFYAVQGQQAALRSQASSYEHQGVMSNIEARNAEMDAQQAFEVGRREKAALTFGQGAERGAMKVEQGASGTELGAGSNAEALASQRFLHQLDSMTLDANTIRAANASRTRATALRNEGLLAGASAANLQGTAGSLSPGFAATSSFLRDTGTLASQWVYNRRYSRNSV